MSKKEDFIQGQIEKKSYRKTWLNKAEAQSDHPINFGIHMDTHHLISAEAIKISTLGGVLKIKGYVIDSLSNLVGFPSTLPGACHLGVQLHRGDHKHTIPGEEAYHKYVASTLEKNEDGIRGSYGRTEKEETKSEIHLLLDPKGEDILDELIDFELPLTEIFKSFEDGCSIGCSNEFDVKPASKQQIICDKNRDHFLEEDKKFQTSAKVWNKKQITYQGRWSLKVGL